MVIPNQDTNFILLPLTKKLKEVIKKFESSQTYLGNFSSEEIT